MIRDLTGVGFGAIMELTTLFSWGHYFVPGLTQSGRQWRM
jgi:hypothetical protein